MPIQNLGIAPLRCIHCPMILVGGVQVAHEPEGELVQKLGHDSHLQVVELGHDSHGEFV